ncbi:MAG: PAS domain S-box protein [Deltaproteobacteria bacterium]|nr:PAS domain S-box protein [Deltaproteobacteria bacterium]
MTAKHAIAQQALEETEARARAVLDTAAEAIVTVDDEGRAETYNAAARRIFGYRAEEVLSRPVALLFPWPLPAELPRPNGTSPASRGEVLTRGHRLTGRRKDGTQVPLELSVSLLRVGTRAIYTCIARDITARVQAEAALEVRSEELARSNAELEQFAYIASHDLQQPLRSVVTFLQLLSRRYQGKLDTQADEYITFAVDGAKRMQTLISDLLAYSRVQRAETPPARVELNALLTEVQENLRGSIEAAGAQLVVWPLPTVLGQSSQLVQLFQNLVDNAIKFRGSATPRVEIGFEARGDEWVFHVKDNGIGLDPAYADKIFVLFQRLHGRGEYPGTGVGLAVAKKIVEQHGGRIWVESRPGQGSTFFFTLPAQTA